MAVIAIAVLIGAVAVVGSVTLRSNDAPPTAGSSLAAVASAGTSGSAAPSESASTAATATPASSPTPSPTIAATTSPAATPVHVPLPSLLAAIGDSYTQAWSVSPSYAGHDNTQFSWVLGTAGNDGVSSLLERFRALGASPAVVDAATSGRTMSDALRQANLVVAAANRLGSGKTAYVTFELGTNDLCALPQPLTDPAVFQTQLHAAMAALTAGLPAGSRILMLPVPDFAHFHAITQADPAAKAYLALPANRDLCPPYLGLDATVSTATADSYLARYDASLKAACQAVNAKAGARGRLYCSYNQALLADSNFTIGDLSLWDRFHPSISGQAKMAADAWAADIWSTWPRH
jgi:lysophospholipase L1-like esterase